MKPCIGVSPVIFQCNFSLRYVMPMINRLSVTKIVIKLSELHLNQERWVMLFARHNSERI